MAGRTADDLEETMRAPLEITCFLSAVEIPVFGAEDADTSRLDQRPQRVVVKGVHASKIAPVSARRSLPLWRPERAQPRPRPIEAHQPRRRVSPRAPTIRNLHADGFDLRSMAMFWGVTLAGSLVAIGIAVTTW